MSYHEHVKAIREGSSLQEVRGQQQKDLAEGTFMAKWPSFLRWALFLPAAIIIAFVGQAIFYLLQTSFQGIEEGSLMHGIINLMRTGVMFGLFVYIGAFVAPRYQFAIAIILLVLATIFASIILLSALLFQNYIYTDTDKLYYSVHTIVGLITSGAIVYYINEELK